MKTIYINSSVQNFKLRLLIFVAFLFAGMLNVQAQCITFRLETPAFVTICSGTEAVLTASGAVTYSWGPATDLSSTNTASVIASPTVTTSYTVTGTTSTGCIAERKVKVTVLPKPVLTVTGNAPICTADGSVELTVSGASTYTWKQVAGLNTTTGATVIAKPTATTIYTVTGKDTEGCFRSKQITVTVSSKPVITVAENNTTNCDVNGSIKLTASGATTYKWNALQGRLSALSGAVVYAYGRGYQYADSYNVTGTNEQGCSSALMTVNVQFGCAPCLKCLPPEDECPKCPKSLTESTNATGTYNIVNDNKTGEVFPNPTSGKINIYPISGNDLTSISITNALGSSIYETKAIDNASVVEADLSNQPEGLYFVKMVNGATTVFKKIIKQ